MTFSKNVTRLLKDIRKLKSKSDPEKRVPIAEEMFGRSRSLLDSAEELGAHAARFAGIAWKLNILFSSLLILTCFVIFLPYAAPDIFSPETYQRIDSFLTAIEVELLVFMCVLLIAPVVCDIILSIVCEHSAVTEKTEKKPSGAKVQTLQELRDKADPAADPTSYIREVLNHVDKMLRDVRLKLDPDIFLPDCSASMFALSFIFAACIGLMFVLGAWKKLTFGIFELFAEICSLSIISACCFFAFLLIVWLQERVLAFVFTDWKKRMQTKKLYTVFTKEYREMYPPAPSRSRTGTSSYGFSTGSYGFDTGGFDASSYVSKHCHSYIYGVTSDSDISSIKADSSLTSSQKEAAIKELEHKSALYY